MTPNSHSEQRHSLDYPYSMWRSRFHCIQDSSLWDALGRGYRAVRGAFKLLTHKKSGPKGSANSESPVDAKMQKKEI